MKRQYYYLLVFVVIIVIVSIIGVKNEFVKYYFDKLNLIYLLIPLFVLNFIFTRSLKKDLQIIRETSSFDLKVSRYEFRYKKRLIWNGFAMIFMGIIYIMNPRIFFLSLLLLQLLLTPTLFPWKKMIQKDFGDFDMEIV